MVMDATQETAEMIHSPKIRASNLVARARSWRNQFAHAQSSGKDVCG